MEKEEEFKMSSSDSELNQRISPVLHSPSSLTQRICMVSSINFPETSLVTHTERFLYDTNLRHTCEIMDEVDRLKKLPKPIGFELEQKMTRMNYSVNCSETSSARCTEGLLNDFDWHTCETKKEIERIKMSSKNTDYELKQKMAFMDHSVNRSETSSARSTEKSLPAEVQLDEAESRKSFTDNQIDALNFQLEDLTVTASTPSTNVPVTVVSTVSDDKPLTSTFPGSDRISSNTDVTRTVFSDTQSTVISTTVCEMQQTQQLSTVISAKTTKANVSTSNWNQFAWNPDAPPFVPQNSTYNYSVASQNYHSTLYDIGTIDAPIAYIPLYITIPGQMQTLTFADQQTLSGQNMPSIAYTALPQMFSSGHANAYNVATPINYNTPAVQNVPNSAAPTITVANYLIGSQQIYSNVNGSGYITYVPSYYSVPVAAQNMSNIAAPVTTAANYLTGSQQIYSNVNGSGYSTCVPSYYSAPAAAQNMSNIAAPVTTTPNYLIGSRQIHSNRNGSGYGTYVPSYFSAPNMTNVTAPMTTAANYPVQSQQIYSNVNGNEYGTYVPPYYNAPAAQNMTNVEASMTTVANYPVQSQQIYSNVNGSGYGAYVSPYYNAPAAYTTPNFATTVQNATNRQGNMQMNRYSVSMSISYNTSQYQYTASGQSSIAMACDPQSVVHPFIAPAAARTSFSQVYQTNT